MIERPRRNRKSETIRGMMSETHLSTKNLIYPLFLKDGNDKVEINSMPGIFRFSETHLLKEIESCLEVGLKSFALFPCVEENLKDKKATESFNR